MQFYRVVCVAVVPNVCWATVCPVAFVIIRAEGMKQSHRGDLQ